jgi:hypothetical protein
VAVPARQRDPEQTAPQILPHALSAKKGLGQAKLRFRISPFGLHSQPLDPGILSCHQRLPSGAVRGWPRRGVVFEKREGLLHSPRDEFVGQWDAPSLIEPVSDIGDGG